MRFYAQTGKTLSVKQADCLVNLFHSYRRQITNYETLCLELNPDAFTLEFDLLGDATIKPIAKKGQKLNGKSRIIDAA